MEGSVKSLIEAEVRSREIVQQAESEKSSKMNEAKTIADMTLADQKRAMDK